MSNDRSSIISGQFPVVRKLSYFRHYWESLIEDDVPLEVMPCQISQSLSSTFKDITYYTSFDITALDFRFGIQSLVSSAWTKS